MIITAVRHGETEGNIQQITQSHAPGKLTEKGIEQARTLASLLQNEDFDYIYSSDLQRAIDTAFIIGLHHPELKINISAKLRERDLGKLDGVSYASIPYDVFDASNIDNCAPGGESWREVMYRLAELLNTIYKYSPEAHILIISHGWTLKVLRSLLTEMSLEDSLANYIANATSHTWVMTQTLVLSLES